jgi:hypothetical protein
MRESGPKERGLPTGEHARETANEQTRRKEEHRQQRDIMSRAPAEANARSQAVARQGRLQRMAGPPPNVAEVIRNWNPAA